MSEREPKKLWSNVVRKFVKDGGKLRFEIRDRNGEYIWLVFGVYADGLEEQIFNYRTDDPREFKSPAGVIAYYRSFFPDEEWMSIPIRPPSDS